MSSENVLTPYEKVLAARKSDRPDIMKYIEVLFDDFIEMHGDRYYKDDKSLVAGIASFNGKTVTVIGNRKGKNIEENIRYNFGMASPEGYRKAVRVMKQAEKFRRPVITFVDTPGAYPGMEAESNGQQAWAAQSSTTADGPCRSAQNRTAQGCPCRRTRAGRGSSLCRLAG